LELKGASSNIDREILKIFLLTKKKNEKMGLPASAISSIAGAGASVASTGLSMIGQVKRAKKLAKYENELQMQLNDHTAETNYNYAEQSANRADERSRALYEDYSSPQAMVKQYKDAGLNIGLMYGNGGGGAGGTGTLQKGAQATSSAVQPGSGGSASGALMAVAQQRAALQQSIAGAAEMNANARLKSAQAEEAEAEADRIKGETPYIILQRKMEAASKELQYQVEKTKNSMSRTNWKQITELAEKSMKNIGEKVELPDIVIKAKGYWSEVTDQFVTIRENSYAFEEMEKNIQKLETESVLNSITAELQGMRINTEYAEQILKDRQGISLLVNAMANMSNAESIEDLYGSLIRLNNANAEIIEAFGGIKEVTRIALAIGSIFLPGGLGKIGKLFKGGKAAKAATSAKGFTQTTNTIKTTKGTRTTTTRQYKDDLPD
jgi:hypothetical protein